MTRFFRHMGRMLFGTARRFWTTVIITLLFLAYLKPEFLQVALGNLVGISAAIIGPYVSLALLILIIWIGFRIMLRGVRGGGGGQKERRRR